MIYAVIEGVKRDNSGTFGLRMGDKMGDSRNLRITVEAGLRVYDVHERQRCVESSRLCGFASPALLLAKDGAHQVRP